VVGVNKYVTEELEVTEILKVDQASEDAQVERLTAFKADRDGELVERRLDELREAARGTGNLLPPIRAALRDRASLGEVSRAMRDVFGKYQPQL
jgi:methylmalonyl-CoA mutase N-terminal domain/subunit